MAACSSNRCRGFTVVEVLVAMTVTGIGLLAVFEALRMANDAAGRIRDEEAAQLLAERRMTALLTGSLEQMGTRKGSEGKFDWEEKVRSSRQPNIAEIVVAVRWRHRGRPFAFELASLREIE